MNLLLICKTMLCLLGQWSISANMVTIPIPQQSFLLLDAPVVQNLGVTPASLQQKPGQPLNDGVYVLKFTVQDYVGKYPGGYDVELDFGSQKLCESYGWGTVNITDIVVACPSPTYIVHDQELPGSGPQQQGFIPPQGQNPLVLTFTKYAGWYMSITNVSLTFTPLICQAVVGAC
jgi:hypothetical protein